MNNKINNKNYLNSLIDKKKIYTMEKFHLKFKLTKLNIKLVN